MASNTIFALSTVPGKAGIAIIRVSGPKSFEVVRSLTGNIPTPRKAVLRNVVYDNELIDKALVICFSADKSFTGEDMVEFHVHGSNSTVKHLSEVLSSKLNLFVADRGEFTRRALENGRMDLSQAEGILALINAETQTQKRQALSCLAGGISNKTEEWRRLILHGVALTEIMIDFSDDDVPDNTVSDIKLVLTSLMTSLELELSRYKGAELVRDGYDVTILGKPNVGKSLLLNYLAGREKAIVSDQAGTTRDIIELSMDLNGFQVNFFDTAGIHKSKNPIEKIGIARAIEKGNASNMRIFILENNDLVEDFDINFSQNDLLLSAKGDLNQNTKHLGISGKTGIGVDKMLSLISNNIKSAADQSSILINERHKKVIQDTVLALYSAQDEIYKDDMRIEIVAECLRSAITQFDLLIGKINVDDILGSVFSSFCIGK